MKLIRKTADPTQGGTDITGRRTWKVLVVDDEADVRQVTELNLRGFVFGGRGLQFLHADSGAAARELLRQHDDIAVALVDVVMETDDAGLKLVEAIRTEFNYLMLRIIIRTGQPGMAPERFVIDNFDIDDYKDKTELTVQRLYTTMRSALKSYRDLYTIDLNRRGLERVLETTPQLYELRKSTLEAFFEGVLMQIIGVCKLTHAGFISTVQGLMTTREGDDFSVRAGTGELELDRASPERIDHILQYCTNAVESSQLSYDLRACAIVAPMRLEGRLLGFIYLESAELLSETDCSLIQVMADQCAASLENFRLHNSLRQSFENAVEMLALVAEYKDSTTGEHIRRIGNYTRLLALEMGLPESVAHDYARAAELHDVGKVGIPDAMLSKPGPLTADEFALVRTHTRIGVTILGREPAFELARQVALRHHERWNGSGYPDGLSGEDIPLIARMVAVADVFDAVVSQRPYKAAWPLDQALTEIEQQSGLGFDPAVVAAFQRLYQRGALNALICESMPHVCDNAGSPHPSPPPH